MNRRGLMAALAALPFATTARAQVAGGRLVHHDDIVSRHAKARRVSVWTPPGYETSDETYPVLYMHDGQNLFDASSAYSGEWGVDEHLVRLIQTGQVRAPIVVGVWNTDLRLREYVPSDLIEALPSDMARDLQSIYQGSSLSQGYLAFLVQELKPFIDRAYRTRPGRGDTLIAGSSMGGLISMYAVLKHPEVFSAAGCLSTHWPLKVQGLEDGAWLQAWRETLVSAWTRVIGQGLADPGRCRFYLDRGDETLDQFYAEFQSRVDQTFLDRGYGPGDFASLVFPGAQHTEASWNQRLDTPLTFLLSPTSPLLSPAPTRKP